jgi:pSer/pThr/pTyr-binding forkhead associated (FHA) protein
MNNLTGVLFCEDCAELLHMTATLVPDEEAIWLGAHNSDVPYGIHEVGGAIWLMVQPEIFFLHRIALKNGQLILGRLDSNDEYTVLKIDTENVDDMGISRLHAALLPLESGIQIEDIGSTNGTRLNGQVLTRGRSYPVNHKDRIELGRLTVTLHVVKKESFVRAVSQRIMNRFSSTVQTVIKELELSTDAQVVLSVRLPGKDDLQLDVLNTFRNSGQYVSLELLHNAINQVLGEGISKPLVQTMNGETTASLGKGALPESEPAPDDTQQTSLTSDDPSAPARELMSELRKEGLLLEKRLHEYAEQAKQLTESDQFAVLSIMKPMVTQVHAWLRLFESSELLAKDTGTIDRESEA